MRQVSLHWLVVADVSAPSILIRVTFEQTAPTVSSDARTDGEQNRLLLWLETHPDLLEIRGTGARAGDRVSDRLRTASDPADGLGLSTAVGLKALASPAFAEPVRAIVADELEWMSPSVTPRLNGSPSSTLPNAIG